MANFTSNPQIYGRALTARLFLVFFVVNTVVFAQTPLSSKNKKALKYYEKGQKEAALRNFEGAIAYFKRATRSDPSFYEAHLRQGSLYNAMGQEDSVYANLDRYAMLAPKPAGSVLQRLSFLAFARGHYPKTKKYLELYLEVAPSMQEDKEIILLMHSLLFVEQQPAAGGEIEMKKLPPKINAYALQYLPSITIDNRMIVYTKRDELDGDEDIVVSFFKEGEWTPSKSISDRINSSYLNEGASTIPADGKTMIFTACDRKNSLGSCDLYISHYGINDWSRPKNLGKPVNTRYWESQPSLSADGKTLYFSSNRPGGNGGRDLWVSRHSKEGWSKPVNLGEQVNSFKDETTPFIHPNGSTLFYSSNGFPGMGGYDLLKAEKEHSKWGSPVNLGYPINSFLDEVALLIAADGATSYFAKERQKNNQIVESNIVSFHLPDSLVARQATYINGVVSNKKNGALLRAHIEVFDVQSNELTYKVKSDSITGTYTMVLPAGRQLACYVKKTGYLFHGFQFGSKSNSILKPDTIDIQLSPIEKGGKMVLSNIYFDFNTYTLDNRSASGIRNVVEIMEQNPHIRVEVSGHTDNVGTKTYNIELSEKRAKEVFNRIRSAGVDQDRISYKGYGDEQPIQPNDTEENRRLNRRIEFSILDID